MINDGDAAVREMAPYGPDNPVEKEDCINHTHKRMGMALLKLIKAEKLGDRGTGRLTQAKALTFQSYYRQAITSNLGDIDAMRKAIWASLFHCMSTDSDPHHDRCPPGADSGPHQTHISNPIIPVHTWMVTHHCSYWDGNTEIKDVDGSQGTIKSRHASADSRRGW